MPERTLVSVSCLVGPFVAVTQQRWAPGVGIKAVLPVECNALY